MLISTKVSFDLLKLSHPAVINAMQGDKNTRSIEAKLYSDGYPWADTSGLTAAVAFKKPDGTSGIYDRLPNGSSAVTVSKDTITAILAPQMLTAPGKVNAAILLSDARQQNQISTFPFHVHVEANPAAEAAASDDYYNYTSWEELSDAADAWFAEQDKKIAETLEGIKRVSSPAIVESALGEVITVSDASDLPLAGLKVFGRTEQRTTTGKNLWPHGDIKVGSTSGLELNLPVGTYIISREDATSQLTLRFFTTPDLADNDNSYLWTMQSGVKAQTLALNAPVYGCNANILSGKASTNMQIEYGSVATAYEPYTGGIPSPNPEYPQTLESVGDSVTVTVCGKNLLKNTATTQTISGVTFTVNDDGSVTANGKATSDADLYISGSWENSENILPVSEGNVICSGTGNSKISQYIVCNSTQIGVDHGGRDISLNLTDGITGVLLRVFSGVSVSNVTIYPMIRPASVIDSTYEPYKDGGSVTVTPKDSFGNSLYLPGIPVTSGGNYTDPVTKQQWICDEVDFERGVYVQRVKDIPVNVTRVISSFTGTPYVNICYGEMEKPKDSKFYGMAIRDAQMLFECARMKTTGSSGWDVAENAGYRFTQADPNKIWFGFPYGTTLAEMKEKCNNTKMVYTLAEENTIPLSAEQLVAFAALHSNYPNTTVFNDAGAGMEVKYVADTKLYIDKKFNELAAALVSNV